MAKAPLASIAERPEAPTASGSIKDAYSDWLLDLHAPTRPRKGKKKSKRLAALRHLAQPTESSAKKQFVASEATARRRDIPADAEASAIAQSEAARRRFQLLADEASYAHFSYEAPWVPCIGFFAMLAAHTDSRGAAGATYHGSSGKQVSRREIAHFPVRVPPTVLRLRHPGRGVVLLFTVEQHTSNFLSESDIDTTERATRNANAPITTGTASGRSETTATDATDWTLQFHYFPTRDTFESRLPWILRVLCGGRSHSTSSPIAVLKVASADRSNRNQVRALESIDETEQALRSLWEADESTWRAVQTFVGSKGSTAGPSGGGAKAWIARPAYRKKDQSATSVWILTSGSGSLFATTEWTTTEDDSCPSSSPSSSLPCQIVKCTTAQSWQTPRVIVETLCQFLDLQVLRACGVGTFAELVVDLVQDADGTWWLLQVKAFQFRRGHLPSASDAASRARSAPDRLETMSLASLGSKSSAFGTSKAKWKCGGKYCHYDEHDDDTDGFVLNTNQGTRPQRDEPSGFLTKKELLSCEFFDKVQASDDASLSGGCGSFASVLQFYMQHQLSKRDRTVLYEPQALCDVCMKRYYALRAQMAAFVACEIDNSSSSKKLLPGPRRVNRSSQLLASRSLAALPLEATAPRKLPALQASQSTPTMGNYASPSTSTPPSYMDELERIEKLLADDEQLHQPHQQQGTKRPPTPPTHVMECVGSRHETERCDPLDDEKAVITKTTTFSWQDDATRGDRVEEMWQSIRLKPLGPSTGSTCGAAPSASRAYNTFSLQAALRETPLSSLPTAETAMARDRDPHLISLVDCRRVFSDELFRASLVRETTQCLLVHRQPVRFVVLPIDDADPNLSPERDESMSHRHLAIGRMALRTLALDIDQSLALEGVALTRGLPPIDGDAADSGCLFMTVPVPVIHGSDEDFAKLFPPKLLLRQKLGEVASPRNDPSSYSHFSGAKLNSNQ